MSGNGSPGDTRTRLKELRSGLLRLHAALLDSERELYDRDIERIRSPHHLLDLVLNDPAFAWLREFSRLVVTIDEALEAGPPPTRDEADQLVARARALISPPKAGGAFEERYLSALQRDPNAVMAHAAAVALLRGLE